MEDPTIKALIGNSQKEVEEGSFLIQFFFGSFAVKKFEPSL